MLNDAQLARVDLNLLVLFETVLEERHVGRAAQRLNLTPSAVSHGLTRLRRLLNDPLFLRTPKGVVPTARAAELAAPVADILARVRGVLASAEPFDAKHSTRRFVIAAPDGVSAVLLPALLADVRTVAPNVDIGVRQILPQPGARSIEQAWAGVLADLESRAMDIAMLPQDVFPARFTKRALYDEHFVAAARVGHPFLKRPTLERFCEMRHLLVSVSGDPHGFIDEALARRGRSRRVALTVPSFMMALATLAETDLIAALPSRLVAVHGAHFAVASAEIPLPPRHDMIYAAASNAAMMDAGVAWLMDLVVRAGQASGAGSMRKRARS
jgi:DNA-binding transcriptional LysR family regulator